MVDKPIKHEIGLHILVAEDNQINQLVAKKILQKLGCTCVVVNDGIECLEQLAAHRFDMVLMDCVMPNMDGLEATRWIRASGTDYGNMPIIACTANAMPSDRQDCLDAGMNDYMDKPVDIQRMIDVLTGWSGKLKNA